MKDVTAICRLKTAACCGWRQWVSQGLRWTSKLLQKHLIKGGIAQSRLPARGGILLFAHIRHPNAWWPLCYITCFFLVCCSAEVTAVFHPIDVCVSLINVIITLWDLSLLEFAEYYRYKIMAVTPALPKDKCSFGALLSRSFGMWHVWPWVEMSAM